MPAFPRGPFVQLPRRNVAGTLLWLKFTEAVGGGSGMEPLPSWSPECGVNSNPPGRHPRELGVPVSLPLRACIPSQGVVARSLSAGMGMAYRS